MLTHILTPRPDVLSGRIQGVIDPDRIDDPKKKSLEAKPLDFANVTYVSTDIRRLVTTLNQRLNSSAAEVGTILFEGPKGQGKSHLITLAFHLVEHHADLTTWLAENKLDLTIPANAVVIIRKFTDFPLESLWQVIGEKLGIKFATDRPPSLPEFRAALSGHKLVLLFDELESGIRAIADPARQQQNLNFLQMVSEYSMREDSNVVLIASVYDGGIEPGLTIKRIKPTDIRFSDPVDRLRILNHRLFAKSPQTASPEIDAVIKSYVNAWQRFGIPASTDYAERLRVSYPFTPELLEVVLQRIPNRGGFQGTRGALGFLATLVRLRGAQTNLLTLSDIALADAEIRTWLADLEPSQNLISCAEANLRELAKLPLADRIASATLTASLAPSSRHSGINEEELSRQVIDPGSDYNQFSQTLGGFVQYASYFHKRDQSFYFDIKENAHAKVELRSLSVQESEAWDRVTQWWRGEVFGESDAIILQEIDLARARLDALQTEGLRFVISPRRLSPEERHTLYFGLKRRNTVLLLEPRDDKTDLRKHKDILAWARKSIAADALAQPPQPVIPFASQNLIKSPVTKSALFSIQSGRPTTSTFKFTALAPRQEKVNTRWSRFNRSAKLPCLSIFHETSTPVPISRNTSKLVPPNSLDGRLLPSRPNTATPLASLLLFTPTDSKTLFSDWSLMQSLILLTPLAPNTRANRRTSVPRS